MKVAFFQPYLANWRIEFLEYFTDKFKSGEVIVYDGGFGGKNDTKSVSGNKARFSFKKLMSFSPVFKFKGQIYPFYFSPFLFFNLVKDMPDVVVTEGEINFINNISILFYCFIFNKKYVWWSLGKVRTRKKNIVNKFLDPIVDFLLLRASCVMARNTLAQSYYINEKGINASKVIVAPNSMNHHKVENFTEENRVKLLKTKKNSQVMLYVGALTDLKRPEDLVFSLSALLEKNSDLDLQLWFVGDGPERTALELLVKKLEIEEYVTFFGKVFDGVGLYFEESDFVVVPGLGGLVINHAMIHGRPVISRLADGTELDLIEDGVTGFLVGDYEASTLVDKISLLLESDLQEMSKNCVNKVSNEWNIDIMYERALECIYLEP
ncbi:glycosyltransferase [Vibrio sp. B1FIG11]|uniref:glycosyltransferase n=1 Tax=Vibrio sp. B1FIG11 TaxID=2751177 RepID=UPI0015F6DC0E|nr:glycosyltransferase [Vibrio sp. B1FIG11]